MATFHQIWRFLAKYWRHWRYLPGKMTFKIINAKTHDFCQIRKYHQISWRLAKKLSFFIWKKFPGIPNRGWDIWFNQSEFVECSGKQSSTNSVKVWQPSFQVHRTLCTHASRQMKGSCKIWWKFRQIKTNLEGCPFVMNMKVL